MQIIIDLLNIIESILVIIAAIGLIAFMIAAIIER